MILRISITELHKKQANWKLLELRYPGYTQEKMKFITTEIGEHYDVKRRERN